MSLDSGSSLICATYNVCNLRQVIIFLSLFVRNFQGDVGNVTRDAGHAWHGASHVSHVDSPSQISSPIRSTDCFGGGVAQACIEYKSKNLQVSNHSLHSEAFLCCLLQDPCPTVMTLVARKCFCHRCIQKR